MQLIRAPRGRLSGLVLLGLVLAASSSQGQLQQAQARGARVGLAPQERAACQLQPLLAAQKRRHLTGGEPAGDLSASQLDNSTADQLIAVPNVSSLNQTRSQPTEREYGNVNAKSGEARSRTDTSERLRQLRQLLVSNNYDAYLVTPKDEHDSEYVSHYDRRLRFITGFTGSHGYALVLLDRAVLFTDGRYALQAEAELDCNWWLVVGDEPITELHRWLRAQGARELKVATDARLLSLQTFDYLEERLKQLDQSSFELISQDLVDVVWDNFGASGEPGTRAAIEQRQRPQGKLIVQPLEFAGQVSWQEKLARLAALMDKLKARHYVISKLDDIAWLLNLRGSDIPMSPLFKAYLVVSRLTTGAPQPSAGASSTASTSTPLGSVEQLLASGAAGPAREPPAPTSGAPFVEAAEGASSGSPKLQAPQVLQVAASQTMRLTLYVDLAKVTGEVREHLHLDNGTLVHYTEAASYRIQVELKDYDVFIMDFGAKFASAPGAAKFAPATSQGRLLLDAMANVAIHVLAKNYDDRLILVEPLLEQLKAVKSEHEVGGMRRAHWRDSLAIAMLLSQLELDLAHATLSGRRRQWTETSAARELHFYRSLMDFNRGESFDTISAYGPNGAIVHYKPASWQEAEASGSQPIGNQSTYLLDSGGQYLDGTTDIARTLHFGQPSEFQRDSYTRVLMGAIDMMSLIFEPSTSRLDDLAARRHLLEVGLNYMHGTGHGIGAYSLVHEQPALIETCGSGAAPAARGPGKPARVISDRAAIQANMFSSVEPGFYQPGEFGIRLENIVVTQRHSPAAGDNSSLLLRFEPISLVPFEPKLMKLELLSNKQKAWLNSYNLMVRLRMTQQINYYLAKLRHSSAPGSIQVSGTASSSRLYHQLRNATTSLEPDTWGRNNHLKLEASRFQELLEQAHKWIMTKTELIPLDVPQKLAGGRLANCTAAPEGQGVGAGTSGPRPVALDRPRQQDEWAVLGADPDGQRLMLTYMSSLPFNDAEAARAALSLSARGEPAERPRAANESGSPSWSQRCTGIECDLLLLEALNSHQKSSQQQQPSRRVQQQGATSLDEHPRTGGGLMNLFQLGAGHEQNSWLSLANIWPLLGLAGLLALQLAVMAYVCVSGTGTGRAARPRSVQRPGGRCGDASRPLDGANANQMAASSTVSVGKAANVASIASEAL